MIFAKNFARNYEKKIIIGTSDTWLMSRRIINIPKKGQIHHFNVGIYASRNVCVKGIGS